MYWIFTVPRRLCELGILGMNRRNAAFVLDHNPRKLYPLVDDKLRMHHLCARMSVPTPAVFGDVRLHSELRHLPDLLAGHDDFVVKPNRGSAGRGVLVIVGRAGENYQRHNGEVLRREELRQHFSDILSGMYSLGGRPDRALIQERVQLHPAFAPLAFKGIPDVRVVVYRNRPAMAMLRLPTSASNGRANLHQGGIGVGVDLDDGVTHHAVQSNRFVDTHPDTKLSVLGRQVPCWNEILGMSRRVAEAVGLGYLGVDVVVDKDKGPMLLEANARPGLAIQIANARGLLPMLSRIDQELEREESVRAAQRRRPELRLSA